MASIMELLESLNTEEAAVSTADLAGKLKASKEGTLKQLTREKDKGHVEGSSQEGWLITEAGRKALEKGETHPSMIDEGVTPRQQFEAIGRRIGIKEDRIALTADIVWSGDFNDVKWVWEALGQADIAADLRSVWVNAWRAKLHKGIPPELETELTGAPSPGAAEAEAGAGVATGKPGGREYIIVEDEPVRVGANLGDYSLQDAKDILAIRALKNRFGGAGQQGAAAQPSATEQLSNLITALTPLLKKDTDQSILRELITAQMELQKKDILSQIPQQGQLAQPKTFLEQLTELKELGPMLRSIFGVPESSGNTPAGVPVQVTGPDGKPFVMDLGQVINFKKFEGEERRADERQQSITGLVQTVRENIPDGIQALLKTVEEVKGGAGAKTPAPGAKEQPQQTFKCGDCGTEFGPPAGWGGQPLKCPNPECKREYTKEELLA